MTSSAALRAGASILSLLTLLACAAPGPARRPARPGGSEGASRQDPSLSGDGRYLASIQVRGDINAVILQEQPSGRLVRLRSSSRLRPHRSPSLSWNGRYLALVGQREGRRLPLIEDRATGRLHPIRLPAHQEPERVSLSPDGRRLAVEVTDNGRSRLRLFDLSALLEADLPPGQLLPEERSR